MSDCSGHYFFPPKFASENIFQNVSKGHLESYWNWENNEMPGNVETLPFKLVAETQWALMYMASGQPSFSAEMLSPKWSRSSKLRTIPKLGRVQSHLCWSFWIYIAKLLKHFAYFQEYNFISVIISNNYKRVTNVQKSKILTKGQLTIPFMLTFLNISLTCFPSKQQYHII